MKNIKAIGSSELFGASGKWNISKPYILTPKNARLFLARTIQVAGLLASGIFAYYDKSGNIGAMVLNPDNENANHPDLHKGFFRSVPETEILFGTLSITSDKTSTKIKLLGRSQTYGWAPKDKMQKALDTLRGIFEEAGFEVKLAEGDLYDPINPLSRPYFIVLTDINK